MAIRKRIQKPKKLLKHTLSSDVTLIPKNLPPDKEHLLETVHAPYSEFSMRASRFPKEMLHVPRPEIIVGLCFSRQGMDGAAVAWVCTTFSHHTFRREAKQGLRAIEETVRGAKPRFVFVGEFKVPKGGMWLDAKEAACEAIYEKYEECHGVNLFAE